MADGDLPMDHGAAVSFGYHVRRRRLALDLTQTALAGRVGCSTATIKKIERDERRPSRAMAGSLAEALRVPAGDRDVFVAAGTGQRSPAALTRQPGGPSVATGAATPDDLPGWLVGTAPESGSAGGTQVVGRDAELAVLDAHLAAAAAGDGRLVLVSGEAGQGKTALVTEFTRRAHAASTDVVVSSTQGTAVGGLGDPYLPFRELLLMLLADPDARWQADRLSRRQRERLWGFAPTVARTILVTGPQLVGTLVPPATLLERAGGPPPVAAPGPGAGGPPSGDQLVGQLSSTFLALARQRPLVLILDDLQWVDAASAEFLFQLSRRLGGSRILLVGAYRPSELSGERGPAPGSAGAVLRLAVRDAGARGDDALITLEPDEPAQARRLCDALIDREPNRLDEGFRQALFALTGGLPLFVVELLREMRDRGDLLADDGVWVAPGSIDWDRLPRRVTAVIEQRLERLDDRERQALDVAAVVGEHFTAEIVAAVLDVEEGELLELFGRGLDRPHGLITETGPLRTGNAVLTRYRFQHVLFQRYLYGAVGDGRRRNLHARVASALEERHSDTDAVATELAHHHLESGSPEAAVPYLLRAGDRARAVYANADAARYYERAVGALRGLGDRERLARTLMKLALTYQVAFDHDRAQRLYDEAFALMRTGPPRGPAPLRGGRLQTLRMVWRDPPSLDPTIGGYSLTAPVATQVLSGLVAYGDDEDILPDVARRWELQAGGRRYVFHLRDDVVWSDGVPVTSRDFAATFRRGLDPATGAPVAPALLDAIRGAREIRAGRPLRDVDLGIATPDDVTLVLDLEEPTSYFIHNLAYYVLLGTPCHALERHGDAWARPEHLIGNGPFLVASWGPGRSLVLERNPRYHGRAAGNVGRVELDLASPAEEHERLYADGRLDVVTGWFTPGDALLRLADRYPGDLSIREDFSTYYYAARPHRAPTSDVRVRRGLAMAVDLDAVAAADPEAHASPATGGFVPPGMPGHVPGARLPYDPGEARRLLTDAGATEAAGGPELSVLATEHSATLGRALRSSWEAVGIATRLDVVPFGRAQELRRTGEHHVVIGGWRADYPDPDNFLRVCVELELPDWRDETYLALLAAASHSGDQDDRLARYAQAERVLADEAVLVSLSHPSETLLCKPWVHDYRTLGVKHVGFWKDVVIEPHDGEPSAATPPA